MSKVKMNQKGFTLVELMIVVAIIGILAAIAIPNFRNYQMKAKTAEAKTNLGAIGTSQESYRAENDTYLQITANPVNVSLGTKQAFVAATGFATIGFSPSGSVYYSYMVMQTDSAATSTSISATFNALAEGDLDASDAGGAAAASCYHATVLATGLAACDAEHGVFTLDHNKTFTNRVPAKF